MKERNSMNQKIVITDAADQHLEEMLKTVNDGFASGRVKKVQLASWIIGSFQQSLFSKQIEKIRADHFDEIAHLKSVVKQMELAKGSNKTLELSKLLNPVLQKSGARKALTTTNDPSNEEEKS